MKQSWRYLLLIVVTVALVVGINVVLRNVNTEVPTISSTPKSITSLVQPTPQATPFYAVANKRNPNKNNIKSTVDINTPEGRNILYEDMKANTVITVVSP